MLFLSKLYNLLKNYLRQLQLKILNTDKNLLSVLKKINKNNVKETEKFKNEELNIKIKNNFVKFFVYFFIFIIIFFIFIFIYSVDIILYLYPDKLINFLNHSLDKEAAGFTFLGAFLPFSHYFVSLKNLYVGVFVDYKKKIYNRCILLLHFINYPKSKPIKKIVQLFGGKKVKLDVYRLPTRTVYQNFKGQKSFVENRTVFKNYREGYFNNVKPINHLLYKDKKKSKFFNIFLKKLPVYEKSRIYSQHKIGTFNTDNFLLKDKQYDSENIFYKVQKRLEELYKKKYKSFTKVYFRIFGWNRRPSVKYKYKVYAKKQVVQVPYYFFKRGSIYKGWKDAVVDIKPKETVFWAKKQYFFRQSQSNWYYDKIVRPKYNKYHDDFINKSFMYKKIYPTYYETYSSTSRNHLAYMHPFINKIPNTPVDLYFGYLPEIKGYMKKHYNSTLFYQTQPFKRDIRSRLRKPEAPIGVRMEFDQNFGKMDQDFNAWIRFPENRTKYHMWYRYHPYNFFFNKNTNKNYFIFLYMKHPFSKIEPHIIRKMPGLFYPLSNKQKFYEGLKKKKIAKPYIPFFLIKNRVLYFMINPMTYRTLNIYSIFKNSDNYFKFKLKKNLFPVVYWNWSSNDTALYKYFFDNKYNFIKLYREMFVHFSGYQKKNVFNEKRLMQSIKYNFVDTKVQRKWNDKKYIYRSNVFWNLYSLYLADIFYKNKVNPYFDGVEDNIYGSRTKTWQIENGQLNEFFLDFGDYNHFDARRAAISPSYGQFLKKGSDQRYFVRNLVSGNFFYGKSVGPVSSFDFLFFKNFYYKYKFKLQDAFYKKSINKLGEFYIYYLNISSDKLLFNFFIFFDYIWNFFLNKFKDYIISFSFIVILYYYNYVLPLYIFLNSFYISKFFIIILQQIILVIKTIIKYLFGDFVYYFFKKGTFFTIYNMSNLSLLPLLVLKIIFFGFLLYLLAYLLDEFYNQMSDTLRFPLEVFGVVIILICFSFFISFFYILGPFSI